VDHTPLHLNLVKVGSCSVFGKDGLFSLYTSDGQQECVGPKNVKQAGRYPSFLLQPFQKHPGKEPDGYYFPSFDSLKLITK